MGQGGDSSLSAPDYHGSDAGPYVGTIITSVAQQRRSDVFENGEECALKSLRERLVQELTAHRTLGLCETLGRSPDVVLTLLLMTLVGDMFHSAGAASGGCLEASFRHIYLPGRAPDLKDSVVALAVDNHHAAWEADLPLGDETALCDYLTKLDRGSRLSLLAHCLGFGINALHEKVKPYGAGTFGFGLTRRMAQADRLAQVVDLNMVEAG